MARFKSISRLKRALMGKKNRKSDTIDGGDEEKEKIVNEFQHNSTIDIDNMDENKFYSQGPNFTINRPINSLFRSFRRKIDGRKRKKHTEPDIDPQVVTSTLFMDQSSSKSDEFNDKSITKIPENLLDFNPDIDLEIPYADEGDSQDGDVVDSVSSSPIKRPPFKYNYETPPPKVSPPPPPISSNSSFLLKENLYRFKSDFGYELVRLAKCGWYWGPISRSEADYRLSNAGDGSFLVRDSSDDHHLLSLSFRSNGRTYHTRVEHNNGLFSFTSQPSLPAAYPSVITLIEESMKKSKAGIFCYSCARSPSNQKVPVRLIKPVSRFHSVPSLQFLCRFVLRLYNLPKLPLTPSIRNFLDQSHYQ